MSNLHTIAKVMTSSRQCWGWRDSYSVNMIAAFDRLCLIKLPTTSPCNYYQKSWISMIGMVEWHCTVGWRSFGTTPICLGSPATLMESILFTYEAIAFGFLIFPSIILAIWCSTRPVYHRRHVWSSTQDRLAVYHRWCTLLNAPQTLLHGPTTRIGVELILVRGLIRGRKWILI